MTHTTDNPTPSPSTLADFIAGGYHDDCPTASIARYRALDDATRQQRFDGAFAVLLDDNVNLDDGLGEAGPPDISRTSWMHTVMGRRAAEMLIRLERSYLQLVADGELEAAWAIIEVCSGFVAVAIWLQEVHEFPDGHEDDLGSIEQLVQRVGAVPYLLVSEYGVNLPAYEVMACAIEAEAMLLDRDDTGEIGPELDRLRTHRSLWDPAMLTGAIEAATTVVRDDLESAVDRGDFDTLEKTLRLGVGFVYLQMRVDDAGEAEAA